MDKGRYGEGIMHIGIISSREHLYLARIMLKSLLDTNSGQIDLHVFYVDLSDEEINRLCLDPERMVIYRYPVDLTLFDGIHVDGHFGIYSYFRILAPYCISEEVERILFLDTDLVIRKDLHEYYNTDFGKNVLVASPSVMKTQGNAIDKELLTRYKVDTGNTYFNAGVLLINLSEFRKTVTREYLLKFAYTERELLRYIDQDLLNIVFGDKCIVSDQHLYNFSPKDQDKDEYINENTIKDAYIIHYCGLDKPTSFDYPNIGFDEFWEVAKKLYGALYFKVKLRRSIFCCKNTLKKCKRMLINKR